MFPKNHSIIPIVVPSYFKLNPDKEEKFTKDTRKTLVEILLGQKGGDKMNYLKLKFTHYSLCYYANDKERKPDDCIIKISCYGHDKKVKQDLGGTALTIKFFKDDSEIPPNEHKRNFPGFKKEYGRVKRISLHYPISQFNDIISILRYEKKPLYLFIEEGEYKDSPKGGLLTEGLVEDDDKYEDVPIEYYK